MAHFSFDGMTTISVFFLFRFSVYIKYFFHCSKAFPGPGAGYGAIGEGLDLLVSLALQEDEL